MGTYAETIFNQFEEKYLSKRPIEPQDVAELNEFYIQTSNRIAIQRALHGKADIKETNFELKTEMITAIEFVSQKAFDRDLNLELILGTRVKPYYSGDM